MTWLVVGVALGVLEWRMVRGNVGAVWNGYGAVTGVWRRDSAAPMRYRVLVPWLLWLLARVIQPVRVWHYQVVKVALMAAALGVVEALLGPVGVWVVGVSMAVGFEFDYWDCYGELLGVGLVLVGAREWGLWAVVVGAVVWGLSKETGGLAPLLGLLTGGVGPGLAGLAGFVTVMVVRLVQGQVGVYCERWTVRAYNTPDLALAREREDVQPWLAVAWTVVAVVAALVCTGWWRQTAGVGLMWVAAGWTLARAREVRVFLPSALWMAAAVTGGVPCVCW